MELIIPGSMTVTAGAILAFLTIFSSILGVYYRLAAQLGALEEKFVKMEERNIHADHETEDVKKEQASQKTAVAVMAQQIKNQGESISRIEAGVTELLRRDREAR